MGISMLAGIVSSILSGFTSLLGKIFNTLMQVTLGFALNLLLEAIKNITAIYLYQLSVFMLSLVDYIEMLFRGLAGMDGSKLTLSINGKTGDLLIQMLTSPEVLDIFYATAIVGVFLLIITTIFSMIKVEYTTEGAQNSKTGILSKSLKSLCNMIVIPLLVILGVFIGNQVLGLIDTATGGGEGAKISGNLWVTGACNALYETPKPVNEWMDALKIQDLGGLATVASTNKVVVKAFQGFGIVYSLQQAFFKTVEAVSTEWNPKSNVTEDWSGLLGFLDDGVNHINPNRDTIESNFIKESRGYSCYNMFNVITYYNLFEVNYIIILIGAAIILKSLYQCCFGLIDRLYRCTALFIVMPMVVGMTPVRDSLGKWRTNFIGRALSAYGIIISMNLFFTISKVLLSVDIKFGTGAEMVLSNTLMVGLLKLAFVVVGCTFINKLASEMGGYFGGEDARSIGQEVEGDSKKVINDATAGIQKSVRAAYLVGSTIATGGGALAGKIGALAAKGSNSRINGRINNAFEKRGLSEEEGANALNEYGDLKSKYGDAKNRYDNAEISHAKALKDQERAQSIIDDKHSSFEDKQAARERLAKAKEAEHAAAKEMLDAGNDANHIGDQIAHKQKVLNKNGFDIDKVYKLKQKTEKNNETIQAEEERKEERKETRRTKRILASNAIHGMVKGQLDKEKILDDILPEPLKKVKKSYDENRKSENAKSDEGKQLLENEAKAKEKKEKEDYEKRNASWIDPSRSERASITSNASVEVMQVNEMKMNKEAEKAMIGYNTALKNGNEHDMNYYMDALRQLIPDIQRPDVGKPFKIGVESKYKVDYNIPEFKKAIEAASKRGGKAEDYQKAIEDHLKKIGQEGNTQLLAEFKKMFEELKNGIGK